jgi:hypothetical protein
LPDNVYALLQQAWSVSKTSDANVYGVEIAIVTNVQDPDKQGRVKVCFPRMPGKPESDWARVAQPAAGSGRGFYWLPEVSDEVLVAFERGQANQPYVIGALWNGKDKPMKDAYTSDNSKRMIQTKSGHQILFNDKSGEEKITIGDKSGKRTLTFDVKDKKFLVEAKEGDVEIHAKKKLVLQCEDIEIKTSKTGKITIGTTFDLKVADTASFKAGPKMELKATKVNLNPPSLSIAALVTAAEQALAAAAAATAAAAQQQQQQQQAASPAAPAQSVVPTSTPAAGSAAATGAGAGGAAGAQKAQKKGAAAPAGTAWTKAPSAAPAAQLGAAGPQAKPPLQESVDPVITPAKLSVVVKKYSKDSAGTTKPYTKPKRQKVVLKTNKAFDEKGTGTFTRSSDNIKFFRSADKDDELKFDGKDNVFKGTQLSGGVTIFAEGAKPSAALDDVKLTLKLAGGSKPVGPDAITDATSVEVTLDICKGRPSAGGDPPPLSQDDKVSVGRTLLVQDTAGHFERAQLIIRQVKPATFNGALVLSAKGHVTAFTNEKRTKGEKEALPYTIPDASKIAPAGDKTLWAEGKAPSNEVLDSGFVLALKDVENDADHVAATAVQIKLDICQSRKKATGDPDAMSADDRVKVGRFVHEQDGSGHHGRALLVVRKIKPEKFKGTLVLKGFNDPKIEIFPNELKTPGEPVTTLPHEIDFDPKDPKKKNEDKKFWVQGKTASGALRDVVLWIHLKEDNPTNGDTILMTVVKFKKVIADIPSTPALANRAGNSPVNRHQRKIADPASNADDFNEDYAANKPLVLLENSLTDKDPIKLSVEVEPANVPVRWAVIRDRRPVPKDPAKAADAGDHKDVIGLAGNKEAPTMGSDAEGLKNTLIADAVGSFHICPFVNCNGGKTFEFMAKDGTRIDREPFIMMNLVLVRVEGVSNDSKGQKINCSAFPAAGQTAANFGGFTTSGAGAGAWTGANSGWHADAKVDVIGGGHDGGRGLDRVFGGWIQQIFLNGIRADYSFPAPPPPAPVPAPRSHQYAFVSNLPDNTHYGKYHYIGAAESALNAAADAAMCIKTAPTLDAAAILDVSPVPPPGVANEGTGGDSAVGTAGYQGGTTGTHGGGYPAPTPRPIGQRWQREMWDAPAIGCRRRHISAGGTLAKFRFNLGFRTDLCFWTNSDLKPDPTPTGVANRLYVSVYKCTWTPDFEIKFHPATGVGTITIAPKIAVTKEKSAANGRAVAVDGFALETRSPFALAWYAVDART